MPEFILQPNCDRLSYISNFQKNSSDQNKNKQRKENIISSNCKLEVKSEFLKCHAVSDSDQNYSSPFDCERNQRLLISINFI